MLLGFFACSSSSCSSSSSSSSSSFASSCSFHHQNRGALLFPKNPSGVGFSLSCLTARERGSAGFGLRCTMFAACRVNATGRETAEQAACQLNCRQERDRSQVCGAYRIAQGRVCSILRKRRQECDRSQVCRALPSLPRTAGGRASSVPSLQHTVQAPLAGKWPNERLAGACRLTCRDDLDCR